MGKQMQTKIIHNCFGKFGSERGEQKVGSWDKAFFFVRWEKLCPHINVCGEDS